MPVTLTVAETYPDSLEARIVSFGANVENRTLVIVLQFGRVVDGRFKGVRDVRYEIGPDSSPSFIQVVNAVPEFRDLRRALETYLVGLGHLSGTVT